MLYADKKLREKIEKTINKTNTAAITVTSYRPNIVFRIDEVVLPFFELPIKLTSRKNGLLRKTELTFFFHPITSNKM